MYAANPGPPYILSGSGNTNTDVWSSSNGPYEYVRTTACGVASFNDWPDHDAGVLGRQLSRSKSEAAARLLPFEHEHGHLPRTEPFRRVQKLNA